MSDTTSLYRRLLESGCELDHHESDLYVRATPEAKAIIAAFEAEGGISNQTPFRSAIDGTAWIDLPFLYDPAWERKHALAAARAGAAAEPLHQP